MNTVVSPSRIIKIFIIFLLITHIAFSAKDKPRTIDDGLIVTGDATIGGNLTSAGELDVAGNLFTLGSQPDTFGLGTFYLDSGIDGVRWRLNREAGWLWEIEVAGAVNPAMRLDAANKLVLFNNGVSGVSLDPVRPSISLGESVLHRTKNGAIKTDSRILAANLSGNNTGDQNRASFNLAPTDKVTFGRVKIGAAQAGDLAFITDDIGTAGRDFAIKADGTLKWATGAADRVTNLYRSSEGTLKTDGALIVGSEIESETAETGALAVAGGLGVAGNLNVGGNVSALSLKSESLRLANPTDGTDSSADIRFTDASGAEVAGITAIIVADVNEQGDLVFTTRGSNSELSEKVRILGNGSVGIGTASPNFKLDVAGELRVAGMDNSVMKGPVLLVPQGDLPMGEFNAGPDPTNL